MHISRRKLTNTVILFFIVVLFATSTSIAQRNITPTDSLRITGRVKNPITYSVSELDTFPKTSIKDQLIYNQNGEIKDTLTGIRGVLLKTLLAPIQFQYDKPKVLNELYLVLKSSDGYTVVFSWNELYNTEIGNNVFIITEMRGKRMSELDNRILFISTADLKAGRRYIKALQTIDIRRAE